MMNFVATAAGAGIAAVILVANLQGGPLPSETTRAGATLIDPMTTAAVAPVTQTPKTSPTIRMIDLRSGATCRIPDLGGATAQYTIAPLGPDCQTSPALAQIVKWRQTAEGTLEMADEHSKTILRFMPGDGVLYESFYPAEALITIVSANG
ncbi:hypothetical protein U0C82_14035 [Fulvimarina sp. 2208YS6-2-32]|uniref:Alkaline proteinase inhibitor/ Outer membrane lipoprotein Omp19 domain-containing protein n=1 Tax=Fulvimarina uroteuthidis TaxID=3098149 RepID=A0ABU5I679_9HYPH|nr:hypothetical protein [Fulvimarina sp. 2208YS6-2-32]MDY8110258.1 hypothetical protein [Fulvimarina sp. 2208YS6-2-32]